MSDATTYGLEGLPGADLVRQGLTDLAAGYRTEASLLVLLAAPRLRSLGIRVPGGDLGLARPFEHRLYELLEATHGDGAYSRYNSLVRRIVSFSAALGRERANRDTET